MSGSSDADRLTLDLPERMFRPEPKAGEIGVDVTIDGDPAVEMFPYTLRNGNAFVEGDILIATAAQLNAPVAKGLVRKGDQFRWPGGKVYYVVTDAALQARVDRAITHWKEHTP